MNNEFKPNLEEQVLQIISDKIGIDGLVDTAKTLQRLGADSIDEVEVIMALEQHFQITIDTAEQVTFEVNELINIIKKNLKV